MAASTLGGLLFYAMAHPVLVSIVSLLILAGLVALLLRLRAGFKA